MRTQVLIIGGGLVGMACAIAMHQQGLQVMLVDSKPAPTLPTNDWDVRIYAITPGNAEWLDSLGVWQRIDKARMNAIDAMHVWSDETGAPLQFDAFEENLDCLGWIVESHQIEHALWQQIQSSGIAVCTDAKGQSLRFEQQAATLILADGREFTADLVVGADGANSWVRHQADISVITKPYEQIGVVASFTCEKPHGNVARQWFDKQGVLAWLPMAGNRISIVWSTHPLHAKTMMEMDIRQLAETVAEAGSYLLGKFETMTPTTAFSLNLHWVTHLVQQSLVLVGDAAHQVHPMAGQGVNLGFRDVIALTETLKSRHSYQSLGDLMLLRKYERTRKADIASMQVVTYGLHHLFDGTSDWVRKISAWGMAMMQNQAILKTNLIRQAIE